MISYTHLYDVHPDNFISTWMDETHNHLPERALPTNHGIKERGVARNTLSCTRRAGTLPLQSLLFQVSQCLQASSILQLYFPYQQHVCRLILTAKVNKRGAFSIFSLNFLGGVICWIYWATWVHKVNMLVVEMLSERERFQTILRRGTGNSYRVQRMICSHRIFLHFKYQEAIDKKDLI